MTSLHILRMRARDPDESHRVASPLELLFDLVFVVSVSFSSQQLFTAEGAGHLWHGIGLYAMVFFAIWWAWMNFTWFASAFDIDDWLYRLLTFVQMAGALLLSAGIFDAMQHGDFRIITYGYVVMRLAMVAQWLRAAASEPTFRATALGYALGITIVQVLWVARLALPDETGVLSFLVLVVAEILVPIVAERRGMTPWHPHHIAERYELFTLIVLGESILASANAIVDSVEHTEHLGELITLAVAALILIAGMWWLYFFREHADQITSYRSAFTFGYGHYVIFASAGAFSAGIEVIIRLTNGESELSQTTAQLCLTVPIAVFVVCAWWFGLRVLDSASVNVGLPVGAVVIAATAFLPHAAVWAATAMIALVVLVESSAGDVVHDDIVDDASSTAEA